MRISAELIRFSVPRRYRDHRLSSRRSDDRGQTVVEAVLCTLILLMLLIGVMEVSMALYTYHFISDAAREGTRYAIVRGSACTDSDCPATAAAISTYVTGLGFLNSMTVTTTWSQGPGPTCTPPSCCSSTSCNNPGNLVQVSVQYQIPLVLPFKSVTNVTMNSTSQMLISQ
jgi:Flp pilus assembly protein TadG